MFWPFCSHASCYLLYNIGHPECQLNGHYIHTLDNTRIISPTSLGIILSLVCVSDHCVHYYDLRNTKESLGVFKGHRKAVSYAKFVSATEIVSA